LSVVLVLAATIGWFLLPEEIRVLFTGPQLATLAFFVAVMVAVMLGVGLSTVRPGAEGLVVRNGLRTHTIGWRQIRGFRFTADDPWAYVLLKDEPGSRPLLAVQRVDGQRAAAAVGRLKKELADHLRRTAA
jgi:hypothetical protein